MDSFGWSSGNVPAINPEDHFICSLFMTYVRIIWFLRRNRTHVYNVYLPHKAHQRAITRKQSAGKRLRLNSLEIVLLLRPIILVIRVRDFPCAQDRYFISFLTC